MKRKVDEKILFLIKQGIPAKVIAEKFGISTYTVYYYRKKLKAEKKMRIPKLYQPVAEVFVKEMMVDSKE